MKLSACALSVAMLLSGCSMSNTAKGGIIGGAGGGALGALIGQLAGNGKGAAIGAAVGTAVGAGAGVLIGNRMDKAKAAAEKVANAQTDMLTAENGMKYVRVTFDSGILFGTGEASLSASAQESLKQFATTVLNENKDMDVAIIGYTDNQGWRNCTAEQSKEKNKTLSMNRANAVFNYCLQQGATATQIKTVAGLGEENPVASNDTKEGQAQNRRVEIYLYASQEMINAANEQAQ